MADDLINLGPATSIDSPFIVSVAKNKHTHRWHVLVGALDRTSGAIYGRSMSKDDVVKLKQALDEAQAEVTARNHDN